MPTSVELFSAMLESAGEGQGNVAPRAKCPLAARHTSPNCGESKGKGSDDGWAKRAKVSLVTDQTDNSSIKKNMHMCLCKYIIPNNISMLMMIMIINRMRIVITKGSRPTCLITVTIMTIIVIITIRW